MSNYSSNRYEDDTNTPWHKIIGLVPQKSRVLDVGCSSGNLGEALIKDKKCEVIGLDLDEKDVKEASKKLTSAYVKNAEVDNLESLGKFDCVIFADVIEHLVDPVKTLKKIEALLKPGGCVVFSIPNMAHMGTRLMLLEGRFVYGETGLLDKTHLHYYDRQEVQRVFKDAGYNIDVFDWVERYLPEKVLTHQLENIGLKPDKTFFNKSKEVESTAYEFIGKATPLTNNKTSPAGLPFASPNIKAIEEQINDVLAIREQEFEKEKEVLGVEIDELLHKEARLISSISWRITLPLRLVNGVLWTVRQKIRIYIYGAIRNPRLQLSYYGELKDANELYRQNEISLRSLKKSENTNTAVFVHLYYKDIWPDLRKRLAILKEKHSFDLFVTLPPENDEFKSTITKEYPDARIFVVPNRGRDVLPFLQIASKLENAGYEFLLKLHTKKSPHREDGHKWFNSMLKSLIPDDSFIFAALVDALKGKDTGIIGPTGQYVSLPVNYDANSYFLFKALARVYSKKVAKQVHENRKEYGFFAGTMFWARVDALSKIFQSDFKAVDFEREKKRIDGTLAHAMERVFCVVPELEGKQMYEVGPDSVNRIEHNTGSIPQWSDLHISKRQKQKLSS